MNNTRVNYIIACHDRNKESFGCRSSTVGYDNEPNIGFIVPEKATPFVSPSRGAYPQCRSLPLG